MSTGIASAAAHLTRPFATVSPRTRTRIPLIVTAVLLVVMFSVGSVRYEGFLSAQVVLNLLIDNGFLLVVAVGATFVILTGGIDLSVGSMVALSTMITAWLVESHGWPLAAVIPLVLLVGAASGTLMGWIIHTFEIQPFIVTLAGDVPRPRALLHDQHRIHHDQRPHHGRNRADPAVRPGACSSRSRSSSPWRCW